MVKRIKKYNSSFNIFIIKVVGMVKICTINEIKKIIYLSIAE